MQSIIIIVLSVFVVSAQSQLQYDCRRMDDCQNSGTCDINNGTCTCTGDFGNYDCGTNTSLEQCNLECQNDGTCHTQDGVETCYCLYGYYGTNCELSTVQLTCSATTAELALVLPPQFTGQVSLVNGNTPVDAACEIAETTEGTNTKYSITIDISTGQTEAPACKVENVETIPDPTTQENVYRASLLVQYKEGISTSLDEIILGNCSIATETVLDRDIGNVAVVNDNLNVNEFKDQYSAAAMVVTDADGALLTVDKELFVGTVFKLIVYLTETSIYTTVRFDSCVANNTLVDASKTFSIMNLGCPTQDSKYITSGQTVTTYTPEGGSALPASSLPVEAFKFSDSQNIGIMCTAKMCKDDDDSCAIPADCEAVRNPPNPTPTQQRKKRAADDDVTNDVDKETVSTLLTVRGPNDVTDTSGRSSEIEQPPATLENCFDRSEILAVVTVLAGFVCILLIACLVLGCILIKRRAKAVEFESMPVPSSERFRIPRARVNDAFSLREV